MRIKTHMNGFITTEINNNDNTNINYDNNVYDSTYINSVSIDDNIQSVPIIDYSIHGTLIDKSGVDNTINSNLELCSGDEKICCSYIKMQLECSHKYTKECFHKYTKECVNMCANICARRLKLEKEKVSYNKVCYEEVNYKDSNKKSHKKCLKECQNSKNINYNSGYNGNYDNNYNKNNDNNKNNFNDKNTYSNNFNDNEKNNFDYTNFDLNYNYSYMVACNKFNKLTSIVAKMNDLLDEIIIASLIFNFLDINSKVSREVNLLKGCKDFFPRTLINAYIYIARYSANFKRKFQSMDNLLKIYLGCCIISKKYENDNNIRSSELIKGLEIDVGEINYLEALVINKLDYNLYISDAEYFNQYYRLHNTCYDNINGLYSINGSFNRNYDDLYNKSYNDVSYANSVNNKCISSCCNSANCNLFNFNQVNLNNNTVNNNSSNNYNFITHTGYYIDKKHSAYNKFS